MIQIHRLLPLSLPGRCLPDQGIPRVVRMGLSGTILDVWALEGLVGRAIVVAVGSVASPPIPRRGRKPVRGVYEGTLHLSQSLAVLGSCPLLEMSRGRSPGVAQAFRCVAPADPEGVARAAPGGRCRQLLCRFSTTPAEDVAVLQRRTLTPNETVAVECRKRILQTALDLATRPPTDVS